MRKFYLLFLSTLFFVINEAGAGSYDSNKTSRKINSNIRQEKEKAAGLPTAKIRGTTTICQNSPTPNITFIGAGGTAPYTFTYKINTGINLTVMSSNAGDTATVAASTITSGTFTYTLISVQDAGSPPATQNQSGTAVVTVKAQTPITSVTATPAGLCLGNSANLLIVPGSQTLFSEDFEGDNTFSVVNGSPHSTGSEWLLQNSPYTYFYFVNGLQYNATFNDTSHFMLTNSNSHANTNSSLVSPIVNTNGYTSLTLTYKTYYRQNSSEKGVVEVSTNDGNTWNNVQTLSSTTGTSANFETININLNTYINNNSFMVRFRYSAANDWWWAIDDIKLSGTSSNLNYSWTASPANAGLPARSQTPSTANANIIVTPAASGTNIYTAFLKNAAGCISSQAVTVEVNILPTVAITADYCTTPGKVHLTADATPGVTYLWNTGQTTQNIDVDIGGKYDVTVFLSSGCSANATITLAQDLIVNGDFSAGNTGFTSGYVYDPSPNGLATSQSEYAVNNDAQYNNTNFWGYDHTSGIGAGTANFMIVSGAKTAAQPIVWQETVPVLPNTAYNFSAWAISLNNTGPFAKLRFSINGVRVGSTATLKAGQNNVNNPWNTQDKFYGTWTSGAATTSAVISILDLETSGDGNNFGLDDISFGTLSTFIKLKSKRGTDDQTICNNNPIDNIVYSVGNTASGPTITGLPAGLTTSFNGVNFTISGRPIESGLFNYTITTTGSCNPTTLSGTITVQSQTISLTSGDTTQSLCIGDPITNIAYAFGGTAFGAVVTGLPDGIDYFFRNGTLIISGAPKVAGIFNYVVATSGNCKADTSTGTIAVSTQVITLLSASGADTVCINNPITDIRYKISGTVTDASISGLPSGVSGAFNSGIFVISGIPSEPGTFTYTITTTGNCGLPATVNGTITVNPETVITLSSVAGTDAQTLCINFTLTNITYDITGVAPGASVTGLPSGLTGVYNAGVFTISGSPGVTGTFPYTVISIVSCGLSATVKGTITVNSSAVISLSSIPGTDAQTLCINNPLTNITYNITGGGSDASVTGLPDGVTGAYNSGVFTISGTPDVTGTYNYSVSATGSCGVITASGIITIQTQTIAITSGTASPTVCMDSPMPDIVFTVGSGATVTGLPVNVTGILNGSTFTISGSPTVSGSFDYTISAPGGCAQTGPTGTITVTAASKGGTLPALISLCSGGSGALNLTGNLGNVLQWESSADGGTSWLPIADTTTLLSYSNVTQTTFYRALVQSGSCTAAYSTIASISIGNVWKGAVSSDWNTPGNWSDGMLPGTSCPTVTITEVSPPNVYPVLNSDTVTINNLVINAGASVTITGGIMQIAGTITNNGGTFDVSNGALEFNGNGSPQIIPANVFATNKIKDLIISNNVSLEGQDSLTGIVSFGSSNKTFSTNDNLTLKSTALNTAAVGQVINGNKINGDAIVERYISAKRAWRFLSVPTQTTQTFHDAWQEGMPQGSNTQTSPAGYGTQVTNIVDPTVANGFDYLSPAGPSVKKYDLTATGPYAPYRSINTTFDAMATKEGLMTFVRGDRTAVGFTAAPTPTVLRTKGLLYTGNQNYPVNTGEFASIGNPYASPLDMTKITKTGTKEFFYVWDPNLSGSLGLGAFQTFSDSSGSYVPTPGSGSYPPSGPYNYIQSGMAFFVTSDTLPADNRSITITESSKAGSATAGSVLVFRPSSANSPEAHMRTNLYSFETDGSLALDDGTLNDFADNYSNAVDKYDAVKIFNFAENLAIKTDSQLLVIERRHTISKEDTIHLNIFRMKIKSYRFEIKGENFDPELTGFLEDSYYNTRIPLDINATTTYDFNVINVPGSWNPDRFRIVFATAAASVLPVTFTSVKAYPKDNDIAVDWKVEDERNIKAYEVERSADGQHFSKAGTVAATGNNGSSVSYQWPDVHPLAGSNYYRIKSIGISGEVIYSNIVKVVTGSSKAQLMVYPNPVSDGNINLQLINQPKGSYGIRLMNKLGQVIMVKQIDHQEGSSTEHLSVKLLAHGAYNLEVTLPDKSLTNINVLY